MLNKELQEKKQKIQGYEKYFEEMATHFEEKRLEVEKNQEKLAALGALISPLLHQLNKTCYLASLRMFQARNMVQQ